MSINRNEMSINSIEMEPEADIQVCYKCCQNSDYCNREMCDTSGEKKKE